MLNFDEKEREALKAQLRLEILQDLEYEKREKGLTPWKVVRNSIMERIRHLPKYDQRKFIDCIGIVLHYNLNIEKVVELEDKDLEQAEYVAHATLDLLFNKK